MKWNVNFLQRILEDKDERISILRQDSTSSKANVCYSQLVKPRNLPPGTVLLKASSGISHNQNASSDPVRRILEVRRENKSC